jgi:DNA polymerase-1
MQLVSDRVTMFDSFKNKRIGPEQVQEKFGVSPEKVVDVQSLAGDSTDNVPGVPGIGIKTAAQLIQEFGDLDTLLAHASEIKQNKRRENLIEHADKARLSRELVRLRNDVPLAISLDKARLSRELVRLRNDVPLAIPLSRLGRRQPDLLHLEQFLKEQGFKTILARIQSRSPKEPYSASPNQHAPSPSSSTDSEKTKPSTPQQPSQPHYELVQTVEALQLWIDKTLQQGLVAVDTETTSLDQTLAELVGISLCLQEGKACYIPLGHVAPGSPSKFHFKLR